MYVNYWGELNIVGNIVTSVTFHHSKHSYRSSFFVSSNIPYDCVLGWDFITQHKLSVQGSIVGGRSSYQLVGTDGEYPIQSKHPANKVQSNGVVITEADMPVVVSHDTSGNGELLVQSRLKGVNKLTLSEGVAIPDQSEIIIEGKIQSKMSRRLA